MIDLHTHSHFSDGSLSPMALLEHAKSLGVSTLALTDHDTVEGLLPAQKAASALDMAFIPGIELSVTWRNLSIHILGLNISSNNQKLKEICQQQLFSREKRARLISEKLADLGYEGMYEQAFALAGNECITRRHFAEVLVQQQICKDNKRAFKRLLKRGRPAYVPVTWIGLEEAIDVIEAAGGIAILAHPLKYRLTRTKLNELLLDFKRFGGKGMEVVSGMCNQVEINQLAALCQQYDLLASVGSDFHGPSETPHVMGHRRDIPLESQHFCLKELIEWHDMIERKA